MNDEPYTEGVDAILDDVIRYARMSIEEIRPLLKELAFNDLRDAKGNMRFAGASALRQLEALTERTILSSPYRRRLDFPRTNRIVREHFGQAFLGVDFPNWSEAELAGLFQGWIEEAAKDCGRRVHLIPCDLALEGVEQITIGPVTLNSRKAFWPQFEAELATYKQEMDLQGPQFTDFAVTSARD